VINPDQVVLQIAEIIREIATRQGNVPFWRGDLRKSIVTQLVGSGKATIGSNLPYARAVHDGRPAITIKPKKKKALAFFIGNKKIVRKSVYQPARKAKPFLTNAAQELRTREWDKVETICGKPVADEIAKIIKSHKR